MIDVLKIADEADIIVDGYAFLKKASGCRVLNLNRPDRAAVFLEDGSVAETTMDDIELKIVSEYYRKNKVFIED